MGEKKIPFCPKSETKQKDPGKKRLKIECSKKMKKKTDKYHSLPDFFSRIPVVPHKAVAEVSKRGNL